MAEYIERKALIKDIESRRLVFKDSITVAEALLSQGKAIRKAIEEAPTADVVEVKRGEWLPIEDDVIFKCSLCDCEVSTSWDYEEDDMFSYCPCCGARMDGEQG